MLYPDNHWNPILTPRHIILATIMAADGHVLHGWGNSHPNHLSYQAVHMVRKTIALANIPYTVSIYIYICIYI